MPNNRERDQQVTRGGIDLLATQSIPHERQHAEHNQHLEHNEARPTANRERDVHRGLGEPFVIDPLAVGRERILVEPRNGRFRNDVPAEPDVAPQVGIGACVSDDGEKNDAQRRPDENTVPVRHVVVAGTIASSSASR